jgi:hypothetical protein
MRILKKKKNPPDMIFKILNVKAATYFGNCVQRTRNEVEWQK